MLQNRSLAIGGLSSGVVPPGYGPFEIKMGCASGTSFVQAEELLSPSDSIEIRLESAQIEVRRGPSSSRGMASMEQAVMSYSLRLGVAG